MEVKRGIVHVALHSEGNVLAAEPAVGSPCNQRNNAGKGFTHTTSILSVWPRSFTIDLERWNINMRFLSASSPRRRMDTEQLCSGLRYCYTITSVRSRQQLITEHRLRCPLKFNLCNCMSNRPMIRFGIHPSLYPRRVSEGLSGHSTTFRSSQPMPFCRCSRCTYGILSEASHPVFECSLTDLPQSPTPSVETSVFIESSVSPSAVYGVMRPSDQ